MRKIIIIGCPGSGKSTFARALRDITGLPLCHLDMLYWNADKTTVPREVFRQRLHEVLQQEQWIMDGNFRSTMELRMQHCDTVFFLDFPVEVCLAGVAARWGKPRSDIPWIETEEDPEFMDYIRSFQAECRPEILALFAQYPDKDVVIFHSHAEADAYLEKLKSANSHN